MRRRGLSWMMLPLLTASVSHAQTPDPFDQPYASPQYVVRVVWRPQFTLDDYTLRPWQPDGKGCHPGFDHCNLQVVGGPFTTPRQMCRGVWNKMPHNQWLGMGCQDRLVATSSAAPTPTPSPANRSPEPASVPPQKEEFATVLAVKGDVFYRRIGDEIKDLPPIGTKLGTQYEIMTVAESEVTLGFRDGSQMTIRELTTIQTDELFTVSGRTKIGVLLKMGELTAHLKHEEVAGSNFSLRTPTAVASIHGTILTLRYAQQPQLTTVAVQEGAVQVTPANHALRPFVLHAGQQVQVSPTSVSAITQAGPVVHDAGVGAPGARQSLLRQIAGTWRSSVDNTVIKVREGGDAVLVQVSAVAAARGVKPGDVSFTHATVVGDTIEADFPLLFGQRHCRNAPPTLRRGVIRIGPGADTLSMSAPVYGVSKTEKGICSYTGTVQQSPSITWQRIH